MIVKIIPAIGWTMIGVGGATFALMMYRLLRQKNYKQLDPNLGELRQQKMEFRQKETEKKQMPYKLFELDKYLAQQVKEQDLSADTFILVSRKWLKWYDIMVIMFVFPTYMSSASRRIFAKMHINLVIRFAAKLNMALREYELGTLPIIEEDAQYNTIYEEIIQLEIGLPTYITTKIHRFVMLSILLNGLRILSPEKSFWKHLEARKSFESLLTHIKSSLSILLLPLDNVMSALCAEVATDIERYFIGDL